jgi:hypothetical protein
MTDLIVENSPIEVIIDNSPIEVNVTNSPIEVLTGGVYNFNITGVQQNRDVLTIASDGQTSFELSVIPLIPSKSTVFLNGLKQTYAVDFMIDNVIFTWLSIIPLSVSDVLEVYYL